MDGKLGRNLRRLLQIPSYVCAHASPRIVTAAKCSLWRYLTRRSIKRKTASGASGFMGISSARLRLAQCWRPPSLRQTNGSVAAAPVQRVVGYGGRAKVPRRLWPDLAAPNRRGPYLSVRIRNGILVDRHRV